MLVDAAADGGIDFLDFLEFCPEIGFAGASKTLVAMRFAWFVTIPLLLAWPIARMAFVAKAGHPLPCAATGLRAWYVFIILQRLY